MIIYRAEVNCKRKGINIWEDLPLGVFHNTYEGAKHDVDRYEGLEGIELCKAIYCHEGVEVYTADYTPRVQRYILEED